MSSRIPEHSDDTELLAIAVALHADCTALREVLVELLALRELATKGNGLPSDYACRFSAAWARARKVEAETR